MSVRNFLVGFGHAHKLIISGTAYLLIALVLFLPLIGNVRTTTLGYTGDIYQNLWDLWWTKYALLNAHVGIFSTTTMLFWPVGANLVYQTLEPIDGLISIPLQSLGLTFAYNTLLFLGFIISGLGAFVLAEYITHDFYAAFFGGLAFSFSAFHIAEIYHAMAFFAIGWTALFLYFILRMIEDGKIVYSIGAGIAFVLVFFMDGGVEEGLMDVLAVFLIIAFYMSTKELRNRVTNLRFLRGLGVIAIIFVVFGSFWLVPLYATIMQGGGLSAAYFQDDLMHNMYWSDNILSFFMPSFFNGIFHNISLSYYGIYAAAGPQETTSYIGYTVLALSIYGISKNFKKARLWILLLVIFGLLTLGPYPQLGSYVMPVPGLYLFYHSLPIFNVIREPGRFDLIVSLSFAILSAIGVKTVLELLNEKNLGKKKVFALSIISIIFILEAAGIPGTGLSTQITTSPSAYAPDFLGQIANTTGNFSFLVLPALPQPTAKPAFYMGLANFYVTILHRPLVGGDITRATSISELTLYSIPLVVSSSNLETSGNFTFISPITENYTLETLKTFSDYGTAFIIVEDNAYSQYDFDYIYSYLYKVFGKPIYAGDNITVFYTKNSLDMNFYKNQFISFYEPYHWSSIVTTLDSKNYTWWTPIDNYGVIITYAPYENVSENGTNSYVNATISFEAVAPIRQTLTIQNYYPGIRNSSHFDYNITVGAAPKIYTARIRLASGPGGNVIGFFDGYLETGNKSYMVFIDNITISG